MLRPAFRLCALALLAIVAGSRRRRIRRPSWKTWRSARRNLSGWRWTGARTALRLTRGSRRRQPWRFPQPLPRPLPGTVRIALLAFVEARADTIPEMIVPRRLLRKGPPPSCAQARRIPEVGPQPSTRRARPGRGGPGRQRAVDRTCSGGRPAEVGDQQAADPLKAGRKLHHHNTVS